VDGESRTFIIQVPGGYDPNTSYPLVLGWHGTGHQGADAQAQMQLFEAAGGTALVVYPNGGAQAPVWSFPGGANVVDEQRDLDFFDALVEFVGDQYCVDGDRIFSTGFSQGAFFSNALGCERPWVVDGIAPVGGGGPWICGATQMAAMIIIGSGDDVSGVNNPYGYGNSAQMSRDFWLDGNGCTQTTAPFDPSPCVAYDCPDRPVVYCEFNGGHTWWGNATAGMLSFFDGL
jgi:poly(3-hydroxybutyrate) depolymerase